MFYDIMYVLGNRDSRHRGSGTSESLDVPSGDGARAVLVLLEAVWTYLYLKEAF